MTRSRMLCETLLTRNGFLRRFLDPPPGVRTEGVEAGLDARKACIEERSVVGSYVSTAEVRLTTQTGPDRRPNATVGGGFRRLPP